MRIKFFIRHSIPSESKETKKFNIGLILNDKPSQKLKYKKEKSDLDIKGRSGWSCTKAGIWYVDI